MTDSGTQVYRYCRDMVGAAAAAVDVAAHEAGAPRGEVAISAPIAYARASSIR